MLRNFTRHFYESVARGPADEGGSDVAGDIPVDADAGTDDAGGDGNAAGTDGAGEAGEAEGSQDKLSVRDQIKNAMKESAEPAPEAKPKKEKAAKTKEAAPAKAAADPAAPAPAAGAIPAPARLSAEAKAEWDKTPPAIQQAFIKAEQDTAAGVEQLKQRYTLIDQALAPHTDALRQMNATPGEAVNRMFLWFKALAGSPQHSFPELAKSMGVDWNKLVAATAQGGQPAPAAGQVDPQATGGTAAPEIPEPVKNYVGQLEQEVQSLKQVVQQIQGGFNGIQENLNTQNEARTQENLTIWSKDKPHFAEVRVDMANLIQSGIVPLKNGQVDLDTAYERAIHMNPEVRAKVYAEQQQADLQVQQQSQEAVTTANKTKVAQARKASASLPVSAPGANNGAPVQKRKPGEKLSVRESLKAAVAELRDQ